MKKLTRSYDDPLRNINTPQQKKYEDRIENINSPSTKKYKNKLKISLYIAWIIISMIVSYNLWPNFGSIFIGGVLLGILGGLCLYAIFYFIFAIFYIIFTILKLLLI